MPDKKQGFSRFFNNIYLRRSVLLSEIILIIFFIALGIKLIINERALVPEYENKLNKKLDQQTRLISKFLDDQQKYVNELLVDPDILNYFAKLLKNNINITEQEDKFESHIRALQENIGFKSLSLIDNNGHVYYSTNIRLQGVNLHDEAYNGAPIVRSFMVSSLTLTPDFSDFLYSSIILEPALYISAPIFKDGKILGVMAFQVDDKKLSRITKDYLDLGRTGEIVLAVQAGSEIVFVTPTRNEPSIRFAKLDLFSHTGFKALISAGQGQRSSGFDNDYRGVNVLATWSFIPRVDWAIVVKIDLKEIRAPFEARRNSLGLFAILIILWGCLTLILYRHKLISLWQSLNERYLNRIKYKIHYLVLFGLACFLYLSTSAIYKFQRSLSSSTSNSQHLAEQQVMAGIESIDAELEKIRRLAEFIALDLQTERLISADIERRLRRDLIENEGLVRITIAYKPDQESPGNGLHAPSIVQDNDGRLKKQMIGDFYDYANANEGALKTLWYTLPMTTKRSQWLNPSLDPLTQKMVVTYSKPFFYGNDKNSPSGVIAISYKLSLLAKKVQDIGIGRTGYSFLIARDGTFLYHPIDENVIKHRTLLRFAQQEGNDGLERVSTEIKLQKPLLTEFNNPATNINSWIYSHPIKTSGWTLATVFSNQEIGLSRELIKKHVFIIIIYLTILLLFCSVCLVRIFTKKIVFNFVNFSNLILLSTLIALWYIIDQTEYADNKSQILIVDDSVVSRFIDWQTEESERKKEPLPIIIPCGIELYSIEQSNPTRVAFSGHIWTKYHKTLHKDIIRKIRIPQAISYTVLSEITTSEGDWDVVGQNVTATLYHEHDYTKYPFDKHQIVIPIAHADISKNIILVPDLAAYDTLDPWKLPGLDTTFSLSSFHARETYFNFTPLKINTDLGIRQFMQISDQYRLAFNVITNSDLLVPFIFFFLPLLVILISIFAVLVLEQRETSSYTMIGPFTGLFFALVLLHRSLHEKAPADHTLYIEYAFFYSYVIIILLVIHAILAQRFSKDDLYQDNLIPIYKILFWPIQLIAWIITTVAVFY